MEEAAKALIYKQAAEGVIRFVRHRPNNLSTYDERDLLNHKFTHGAIQRLIVSALELVPLRETLASTRKKTFTRSDVEALLRMAHTRAWIQRSELERGGRAKHELDRMFELLGRLDYSKKTRLHVNRAGIEVVKPDEIDPRESKQVWDLATVVVGTASETVSRPFTSNQRREFAEQLTVLAVHRRRLNRLSTRKSRNRGNP